VRDIGEIEGMDAADLQQIGSFLRDSNAVH
jgi:hypothetical protein